MEAPFTRCKIFDSASVTVEFKPPNESCKRVSWLFNVSNDDSTWKAEV